MTLDKVKVSLQDIVNSHWNESSRFEPVGCRVEILLEDGRVVPAYRKQPTETKESPKTYFRISDDTVITENHVGWRYL